RLARRDHAPGRARRRRRHRPRDDRRLDRPGQGRRHGGVRHRPSQGRGRGLSMPVAQLDRPRLELSGPKLKLALESLVARAEEQGGVEAYVEGLKLKSRIVREAFEGGPELRPFRIACAHMATVRRRIGAYASPEKFDYMKKQ